MYKEIKGDLLVMAETGEFDVIAHGCNCHKRMASGIAFQIANTYPKAEEVDTLDERLPMARLGDMSITDQYHFDIANLYTQFRPGKDLNYAALKLCLHKLGVIYKDQKVGIPLIGCGIAGGEWDIVRELAKESLKKCDTTVVIFNELDMKPKNSFRYNLLKTIGFID